VEYEHQDTHYILFCATILKYTSVLFKGRAFSYFNELQTSVNRLNEPVINIFHRAFSSFAYNAFLTF
jgi:hypothetical protein